jgi:hypothetical protein
MKTFLNLGGMNNGFVWSLGWFWGLEWKGLELKVLCSEDPVFTIFSIQILKFLIEIAYIKKNG